MEWVRDMFNQTIKQDGMGRSTMTINGLTIEMRGNRIYVNGQEYGPLKGGESANILEPRKLELDSDGRIVGNIPGGLDITGQNVTLVVEGNIEGPVNTGGDVTAKAIHGSVNAGGDVTAREVYGTVNASTYRRG